MSGALGIAAQVGGIGGAIGSALGLGRVDVTLGGFVFSGATFAVPGQMKWGASQVVVRHRLPGGTVIVDAMGPDWPPISWSGSFDGPGASDQAKALSALTKAGALLTLTWQDRIFLVVIRQLTVTDKLPSWVPYQITCDVVADADQIAGPPAPPSLLQQITADINAVLAVVAAVAPIIAAVQTAIGVVNALTSGTAANAAAVAAVAAFRAEQAASQAQDEAAVISLGAGAPGPRGAMAWLTIGTAQAGNLAQLAAIRGFAGRVAANLAQASA